MKRQPRTEPLDLDHPSAVTAAALNKSFDSINKAHFLATQTLKIKPQNDSLEQYKKTHVPKKRDSYLQKGFECLQNSKSQPRGSKGYKGREIFLATENSQESESERRVDYSKEELNQSLSKNTRSFLRSTKGNSFSKEDTRYNGKESDLSQTNFYFHTYDNNTIDLSNTKKKVDSSQLANGVVLMKGADNSRRQTSGSTRRSKKATPKTKGEKLLNKSFCNLESVNKSKYSPSQRVSTQNDKNDRIPKVKMYNIPRHAPPVKGRKLEEEKNVKSCIAQNGNTIKQGEIVAGKEKGSTNISVIKKARAGECYKEYKEKQESRVNTENSKDMELEDIMNSLEHFTEKEMADMNEGLMAYYDLLIERDQVNSRLLGKLKENFASLMKEFIKNYYVTKQYDRIKQKYEEDKERARREKDMLESQLRELQRENAKLKDMNTRGALEKVRETSSFSKDVQRSLKEERKLMELLEQREMVINSMKEKENKYISLIEVLVSQGIDVEQLFREHENSNNAVGRMKETASTQLPRADKEPVVKNIYHKMKTEEDEEPRNDNIVRKNTRIPPSYGQKYWERQFTEASNSRAVSSNSRSYGSSKQSAYVEAPQYITYSQLDTPIDGNNEDIPVREADTKQQKNLGHEKENTGELKDKLKLDLSTIHKKLIKQYHDEFLEKWSEFTSSWKRGIRMDKTFVQDPDMGTHEGIIGQINKK